MLIETKNVPNIGTYHYIYLNRQFINSEIDYEYLNFTSKAMHILLETHSSEKTKFYISGNGIVDNNFINLKMALETSVTKNKNVEAILHGSVSGSNLLLWLSMSTDKRSVLGTPHLTFRKYDNRILTRHEFIHNELADKLLLLHMPHDIRKEYNDGLTVNCDFLLK